MLNSFKVLHKLRYNSFGTFKPLIIVADELDKGFDSNDRILS